MRDTNPSTRYGIWTTNVGKSFDNDAINAGGFLTVLGANFGFGKPVVAPK